MPTRLSATSPDYCFTSTPDEASSPTVQYVCDCSPSFQILFKLRSMFASATKFYLRNMIIQYCQHCSKF